MMEIKIASFFLPKLFGFYFTERLVQYDRSLLGTSSLGDDNEALSHDFLSLEVLLKALGL